MLVAFGMLLVFAPAQFGALIELEVSPDCEAAVADFQARVNASVVGTASRSRRAHVVIHRRGARYRVDVRTDGDGASGTKRIAASSCEEAVSTAITVLALALSEPAAEHGVPASARDEPAPHEVTVVQSGAQANERGEPAASSRESVTASEPAHESAYEDVPRLSSAERTSDIDRDEPSSAPKAVRFALRAGIDAGTLASATGYLGALAAIPAGPFEWRALVVYGLPSAEERIDPGIAEFRREHYFLFDLGGCYGFGDRVWLAACAAGELSFIQRAHIDNGASDERTFARVAGVLSAHVAYRGGTLQPEFELGAAAAAFGAGDAGPLALRASFGLGLQF
jgi:hypothetical protein